MHTENVLLIDPQKRIRGVYDGTDDEEIERLMVDIEILFKEYPNFQVCINSLHFHYYSI